MRYKFLDGIRAIAIFLVFNVHFFATFEKNNYYVPEEWTIFVRMLHGGHIGVDLFFVLSGYLIFSSISKFDNFSFKSYLVFLKQRFQRLFPAHVTVLAILAFLVPVTLGTFISNALFFNTGMNFVTWSLIYEWTFYIFWGLLIWFSHSTKINEWSAIIILTGFFLTMAVLLPSEPIIRSMGFVMGILIYKYKNKIEKINSKLCKILLLIVSMFLILYSLHLWVNPDLGHLKLNLVFLAVNIGWAVFIIVLLSSDSMKSFFSRQLLVSIGLVSYSFYLVHATVIDLVVKHIINVRSLGQMLLAYAICFGLSYFVGFVLFNSVEFIMIKKQKKKNHGKLPSSTQEPKT